MRKFGFQNSDNNSWGGEAYNFSAARFPTSPLPALQALSDENGARKSTIRADRLAPYSALPILPWKWQFKFPA